MGRALEILQGYVTAPSTTYTALTMSSGNSLTVRNAEPGSEILLLNMWAKSQTAGRFRVRSPLLHDNVQGIRIYSVAALPLLGLPMGFKQQLEAQDTLIAELTGSATGGDLELGCLLLYYASLPGVDADLRSPEDVLGNMVNIVCVENTISSGTGGVWAGGEAINAETDLLRANTDYAILGYLCGVISAAIRYRASAWGNLGIGGPGPANEYEETRNFFVNLSRKTGLPLIPVFNSADRANVLIDCAQDEDGADPIVTTILAELPS